MNKLIIMIILGMPILLLAFQPVQFISQRVRRLPSAAVADPQAGEWNWIFDEKIGYVPDGSTSSNDAFITETIVFTNETSPNGTTNSFKFEGGFITVEDNIGGGTNAFTDAAWVRSLTADYVDGSGTLISESSWQIIIHKGSDTWRAFDDTTFPDSGFNPGTNWHHVAVVYNPSKLFAYAYCDS